MLLPDLQDATGLVVKFMLMLPVINIMANTVLKDNGLF